MLVHQRTPWAPLRCSLLRWKTSLRLNPSRTTARRRGLCGTTRLLFNCTSQVSQSSPSAPRISTLAASSLPALSPDSTTRHEFTTSSRADQQHDGKDEAPAPNSASSSPTLLGLIEEIEVLKRTKAEPSTSSSPNHENASRESHAGAAVNAAAEHAERDKTSASSKRASKAVSKMRLRRHLNARRGIGAKSRSKVVQPASSLPVNLTTPVHGTTDATRIQRLEELTGHSFNDPTYIKLAATNMDVEIDDQILRKTQNHLAIIGDAAYKLCFYVDRFPSFATAAMSREYDNIARNTHMARVAVRTRLGVLMKHLGPVSQPYSERNLATVFEATLGAIYLDSELNLGAVKAAISSMEAWSSIGTCAVKKPVAREGRTDVVQKTIAKEKDIPAVYEAAGKKKTADVVAPSPLLPNASSVRSLNDLRSSLNQAIAIKDTTLDSSEPAADKLKAKAESKASPSTLRRQNRRERARERARTARLQLEREQEQLESLGLPRRPVAVTESPSLLGTSFPYNPNDMRSPPGDAITDKNKSAPSAELGTEESKAHSSVGAATAEKNKTPPPAETEASEEAKTKMKSNPGQSRRARRRAELLEFKREQDRLEALDLMEEARRRAELQSKRTQVESAGRMRRLRLASFETEEEESKAKLEVETRSSLGATATAEKNKTPPSAETEAPESETKKRWQLDPRQRRLLRKAAQLDFARRMDEQERDGLIRRPLRAFIKTAEEERSRGQKVGEETSVPPTEQKGTKYAMFHV